MTFSCSFTPSDPTLSNSSCTFTPPSIAAGGGATDVTLSITSTGPNTGTGPSRPQLVHPAERRSGSSFLTVTLPILGIVFAGIAGHKISKHSAVGGVCVSLALFGIMTACGGGGGSGGNIGPQPVSVSVSPPTASVPLGGTLPFTATVKNTGNTAVMWSLSGTGANGSTISDSGLLTVPTSGTTPLNFTVVATSQADTSKTGSSAVTVPAVGVSVSPTTPVSLYADETGNSWPAGVTQQQFGAIVSNAANTSVSWSVPGGNANGSIDLNGLYSSPASVPNPAGVTVTAISQADPTKSQSSATFDILQPTAIRNFTVNVTATEGSKQHSQQVTLKVE